MSNRELDAALSGAPWSFGGVVFGLDRLVDDEGRPVSERRAPSEVKKGVSIELRPCPYGDERRGRPMNVSALAQITSHFDAVLEEVCRFHASLPPSEPSWDRMLTVVVDQLSAPARYMLDRRDQGSRVPAKDAVGRKLAAGYYGVLRRRLMAESRGERLAVSVETFDWFMHERRALIGASEVCAGPPHMIARATESFLYGAPGPTSELPRARFALASRLAQQVRLGIAWELFDLEAERRFLLEEVGPARMRARNPFIAGELQRRLAALDEPTAELGCRFPDLPEALSEERSASLAMALAEPKCSSRARERTMEVVKELYAYDSGAIELSVPGAPALLASAFADYVATLRAFIRVQGELEIEIRSLLDYPLEAPVRLHPGVLPKPKALRWYETALGHSIRSDLSPGAELTLGNHLRSSSIANEV